MQYPIWIMGASGVEEKEGSRVPVVLKNKKRPEILFLFESFLTSSRIADSNFQQRSV